MTQSKKILDNRRALDYAKKFADEELLSFMKVAEKNSMFGTLYYHPKGAGVAEFIFQDGECLRCIEPLRGDRCTFNKSTKFN